MKIALFSSKKYDRESFALLNEQFKLELSYMEEPLNARTLKLASGFDAVCVFVNDTLNAEVISVLADIGVRLIALRCAGFNNVNLETARERGVKVVRVPAYSPEAVAEHAMALILTLNRKIHKAYNRIRENNFSIEGLTGFNIHGKTVGVVGTGLIGEAFLRIALGFGSVVLANDLQPKEHLSALGVRYTTLEEVLAQSDIVSLHCPLVPATHHMLNSKTLGLMKKGAMLINTSRGALLHTEAVIQSLKSGALGYLGMDVYEQEEGLFFKDLSENILEDDILARLMTFPNVIITGHQGFFTKEALHEIAEVTLGSLKAFQDQQPIPEKRILV